MREKERERKRSELTHMFVGTGKFGIHRACVRLKTQGKD